VFSRSGGETRRFVDELLESDQSQGLLLFDAEVYSSPDKVEAAVRRVREEIERDARA
jgi:hypothetical protein